MTIFLFWAAVVILTYTYVLFPILVFLRGLFRRKPCQWAKFESLPRVSIVIAAHNEARNIGAKLEKLLSLDYPKEKIEIQVASDGSNDGTNEIVRRFEGKRVKLLSLPRVGKATALNTAVAASSGEILIFSDANSIFEPGALRALVQPFTDAEVGGVAGNQCYWEERSDGLGSEGEKSYWRFDRMMKKFQSQAGNVISATGAIYAIRSNLFQPVPDGVTDDFVTSTQVITQGYRLVFAPDAVAYEPVASSSKVEFGRKVRIISRGLRAVLVRRQLLNPFRYGFYAVQLFSHKVLRRLMVIPLLVLLIVSPFLWLRGGLYQAALMVQAASYGLSVLGFLLRNNQLGKLKIFSIPFYFCMINIASLVATFYFLQGRQINRWEPQRKEGSKSVDVVSV